MTAVITPEQIQSRERMSDYLRKNLKEAAARYETDLSNHENDIWGIESFIPSVNLRYSISNNPIVLFEIDMHDIWASFLVAAKFIDADSPEHDRLCVTIISAREMGTLKRNTTGVAGEEADMKSLWVKESMGMSVKHRTNLSGFIARLTAMGACGRELGWLGLWIFREALESKRPLKREDGASAAVLDLLPACFVWLKNCCNASKLLEFAVENQDFNDKLEPGELARSAGVDRTGFSMKRWLFWRQRYKELSSSEDDEVAKQGEQGFNCMIAAGRRAGYGYQIPGEQKYWNMVNEVMGAELKRSGKDSVSSEEVTIDKNWADA